MSIPFTQGYPVLPVAEIGAALAYYRDRLGFKIEWRDEDRFAAVSGGVITLFLEHAPNGPRGVSVVLNVEDADAVHARYVQEGVKIVDPIETRWWGMREFTAEDLDGNRLRIGHVDESAADYSSISEE
ncbi:MAG: VOC family protein [Planctomycetota bacterium]